MAFTNHINAQHGRLFLWVPICLSVGVGGYFSIGFEPANGLIEVICIACVICGVLVAMIRSVLGAVIFRALFLIILGFLIAVFRTHSVAEPVLGWRYYGPIEGTIIAIDRSNSNKPRVVLKNVDLGKISKPRTPTYVRVSFHSDIGLEHLIPGAHIRTVGSVSPPSGPVEPGGFDFQMYAWFKKLGAVGYSRKPIELIKTPKLNTYSMRLFDLRMRMSDHIRKRVQGPTGSFAAAILTGDRSTIDPEVLQDLRDSNLAHLLAISGLHMGLLVGFCFALVRYGFALCPYVALYWPTKKIGAVVAILAGFTYLQISGAAVATERAFIMVSVMLVGVIMDKPAITLRAVALAACVLLILHPESLLQPGFQMSFAATTALVACFEFLKHQTYWHKLQFGRNRFLQPFIALVISSFIAGAATAPFAAYHFNQVAQYGLIANLSSVPVMGMIVMPAAVLAGVLSLIGLDAIPFWIMGQGIDWILGVAHWVANLNGSVFSVFQGQAGVLPMIGFGAIFFILWRGHLRWAGVILCCLGFILWGQTSRPEMLVSDTGRLIGILEDGERSLNRVKGSGFAANVWLENDGDRSTQTEAATRTTIYSDVMTINLGRKSVGYVWPRKTSLSEMENLCVKVDVLVAPNWKEKALPDCMHITKSYLRYQGAVAFVVDGQSLHIKTARHVTGERLWNTWWLRKRPE